MATITQQRLRGRPAHTPGPTFLTYTPNGKRLITVGSNNSIRIYTTGSDGEPQNIDECQDSNTAVVASDDFFITGSEDGTVCMYTLDTYSMDKFLVRCTLPIRDLAISPDTNWVAVASDELTVKVVNVKDTTRVIYLREQPKAAKHVVFDPSGSYVAVSCTDGIIYIYSLSTEEGELVRKVDGVIRNLESDAEACSRVAWHPDGRAFGAATATRDIQIISSGDGERQRAFASGHTGDITALSWSPNGALLASAGADQNILLWETKTQTVVARYNYANVINLMWHPTENIFSFTTSDGELFIYSDFVPPDQTSLLKKTLQPSPFIHDPLSEVNGNSRHKTANGADPFHKRPLVRARTPDSLDEMLDPLHDDDSENLFIEDDDGAGYAEPSTKINEFGKRPNEYIDDAEFPVGKRRAAWQPKLHPSFQPSSTPWRGNRRYLCLNLTGFVWTVDQDMHHTVTVEFYDRGTHRDFHFTDPYFYDKVCLNDHGTLFSCPPNPTTKDPAVLFYRPHETWTARTDWRISLPPGEDITAIALSDSYVVATTSANYVRVYTLFGVPFRIYRQKASPTVTCAAWRDYVLTIGNGPVGADGSATLVYTIENVKRDEVCQAEDVVALPSDAELNNVFFSDVGDPCIYDTTGVLLVLLHWRTPGQARWVPLLDTKRLDRLASGRKTESYWPVAVALEKFHCIILKGGDRYPYFPRPLLSEFDFQIPVSGPPPSKVDDPDDPDDPETRETNTSTRLEESLLRTRLLHSLQSDLLASTTATASQKSDLARRELDADKILLQLLAIECRAGEERGMKALEIVGLMTDRGGRLMEAAGKVAERYERGVLGERIRELAERRLLGEEEMEEF
ncbi:MAG: hypothetical protein M1834_007024 [Cirrosporium novae-zelandiae]|nr:MAG: hypothetical protein M1834_007024 [Cirrosporium novae-zelandiae]